MPAGIALESRSVRRTVPGGLAGEAIGVLAFVGLLALSAKVALPVPGSPVPMTLQTLAVLAIGYFLSARQGVGATVGYLLLGSAGVPVFAPGSTGLLGITGGYLAGFIVAGALIPWIRQESKHPARLILAGIVGLSSILACGVLWQVVFFGLSTGQALSLGAWPFVFKGSVEIGVTIALVLALQRSAVSLDPR